jgi:hypothetical protein
VCLGALFSYILARSGSILAHTQFWQQQRPVQRRKNLRHITAGLSRTFSVRRRGSPSRCARTLKLASAGLRPTQSHWRRGWHCWQCRRPKQSSPDWAVESSRARNPARLCSTRCPRPSRSHAPSSVGTARQRRQSSGHAASALRSSSSRGARSHDKRQQIACAAPPHREARAVRFLHTHARACTYTYTHARAHTHTHKHTNTHTHTHTHTCAFVMLVSVTEYGWFVLSNTPPSKQSAPPRVTAGCQNRNLHSARARARTHTHTHMHMHMHTHMHMHMHSHMHFHMHMHMHMHALFIFRISKSTKSTLSLQLFFACPLQYHCCC